jgi:hypothetical protein
MQVLSSAYTSQRVQKKEREVRNLQVASRQTELVMTTEVQTLASRNTRLVMKNPRFPTADDAIYLSLKN